MTRGFIHIDIGSEIQSTSLPPSYHQSLAALVVQDVSVVQPKIARIILEAYVETIVAADLELWTRQNTRGWSVNGESVQERGWSVIGGTVKRNVGANRGGRSLKERAVRRTAGSTTTSKSAKRRTASSCAAAGSRIEAV